MNQPQVNVLDPWNYTCMQTVTAGTLSLEARPEIPAHGHMDKVAPARAMQTNPNKDRRKTISAWQCFHA